MREPEAPLPVKLMAAIIWRDGDALAGALRAMTELWGPLDFEGRDHPFDLTDYYREEMGTGLLRRLVAFRDLAAPDALAAHKLAAVRIEADLARAGRRTVNIDVGYFDTHKLVLASLKFGGPKVAVGGGVWADTVCWYRKGRFLPAEWTFADFKDGRYEKELLAIRTLYKAALGGA